jgi:LAGLIDADG-like domain
VRFALNQDEGRFVERISAVARELGCTISVSEGPGRRLDASVRGPAFLGLVEQFVDGSGSGSKHLSRHAWRQGPEFLRHLLMGYLDGDGSWTERHGHQSHWRVCFTGANTELAGDLRAICAVLGYRISLKRSNAKFREVDYPTYTGWIKTGKPRYHGSDLERIVAIEQEPKPAPVYDIQVDGDHLFCLANGIQTHNSHIAATLNATGASRIFTQDVEDMAPVPMAVRPTVEQALAAGELDPAELPDAAIAGLVRADLIRLARALKAQCDALGIAELPRLSPKPSDDEVRAAVREVRDRVARERRRRADEAVP